MTRTIELSAEQKDMFQVAFKASNDAVFQAQALLDVANAKRKAFEDLVLMYCLSTGLDKTKVRLDPQTWTIFYDEEIKDLKL